MVLHVDLDAAYLILLNGKSKIAGYYFLFDYLKKTSLLILNRAILVEYKALCHVLSLSAKAEIAGVFYNA